MSEIETDELQSAKISFPLQGGEYSPLINATRDGYVYSHSLQTIQAPPDELYNLWSDVSLIPRWQEHVVSCTPVSGTISHWVVGNPEAAEGKRVAFDSEITEAVPGRRIAWRSITPEVEQSGSVDFSAHPAGRGSIVLLRQVMKMPGGAFGNTVLAVAERSPTQTVAENLRHFKQLVESGEIPAVKGQPHGPRGAGGSIKEWMYGESNPTPPGTSNAA